VKPTECQAPTMTSTVYPDVSVDSYNTSYNYTNTNYSYVCLRSLVSFTKKLLSRSRPQVFVLVLLAYVGVVMMLQVGWWGGTMLGQRPSVKGSSKLVLRSEKDSILVTEFGRRRKMVSDTCEKHGAFTTKEKMKNGPSVSLGNPGQPLPLEVETDQELWSLLKKTSHHQFFVQREWGLMWCKVPKAASTSWLHAFLTLAQVPEHEIPEDNAMGLHALLRDKYPLLSKNLNNKYMPASLKFLVVRHPFERIMSAYADKLQSYNRDLKYRGGYYFAMYGSEIVEKYRPRYQAKFPQNPLFLQKEPSFVEFVHYLIETPITKYDEHWRPQFLLCPPCHFKFDIIVKMETFKRDTDFILYQRDLNDIISFSNKQPKVKSKDLRRQFFSQLSKNMVKTLYDKYRVDFEMFEYDISEFIKYATDSDELMPDKIDTAVNDVEEEEDEEEEETENASYIGDSDS